MKYENVWEGSFISRPNRFIAYVEIQGSPVVCHVKNTGRCRELLTPGAVVYLEKSGNPARKTEFDLIAVKKGDTLINMDSQAPNTVAREWVLSGGMGFIPDLLRPEYKLGDSRFDLYFEHDGEKWLMEVKGVTLEENGVAMFPDAPTQRGVKHLNGLGRLAQQGMNTCVLFVVQMKGIHEFRPNVITHPEFAQALSSAKKQGVRVLAYDCEVMPDRLTISQPVPVKL